MTVQLELDEQQARQLEEAARRLNVTPHELAKAAVADLLARPEDDFATAAQRVLEKNAELYDRLAR